jgi:hypothetical protein
MNMRLGIRSITCLYRTGSLETATSELEKYNLDLEAVKEVAWVERGSQPADDYILYMEMLMLNIT